MATEGLFVKGSAFSFGYRPIIVICNPEGVTMFLLEDHNLAA